MAKRNMEANTDGENSQQMRKLRLKWTPYLHSYFAIAVYALGGPFEARPTAIKQAMEIMGVFGVTTLHIKSHLQKYREKYRQQVFFSDSRLFIGEQQPTFTASTGNAGTTVVREAMVEAGGSGVQGQVEMAMPANGSHINELDEYFNWEP